MTKTMACKLASKPATIAPWKGSQMILLFVLMSLLSVLTVHPTRMTRQLGCMHEQHFKYIPPIPSSSATHIIILSLPSTIFLP